jgi:hypothetical protein
MNRLRKCGTIVYAFIYTSSIDTCDVVGQSADISHQASMISCFYEQMYYGAGLLTANFRCRRKHVPFKKTCHLICSGTFILKKLSL